jgi:acylphosphatase
MSENKQRMRLSVTGRVQGVGFRNHTVKNASRLQGVTGWVKNESDGSVTVVAEGPPDQLDQLKQAVEEGPSFANVESITENRKEPTGEFSSFEVRY